MGHQIVETRGDFLQFLDIDVSMYIMSFLDDPADLVRACAVSRFWYQFVVSNGLAKQLCLKRFPELSNIIGIQHRTREPEIIRCKNLTHRDDQVYASLLQVLTKSEISPKICIANALSASSTNSFLDESVVYTLNPCHEFMRLNWSSTGQSDPQVPETLVYKLRTGTRAITEIDIKPCEAYSSKYVRFRIGYPKSPMNIRQWQYLEPSDDKFEWSYTSPEFPMSQEEKLQPFVLPDPFVCKDGYLQIELLGRVRQKRDGLFYIRLSYVQVLGRPLAPAFDIDLVGPDGKFLLNYYPANLNVVPKSACWYRRCYLLSQLDEMLMQTQKKPKLAV